MKPGLTLRPCPDEAWTPQLRGAIAGCKSRLERKFCYILLHFALAGCNRLGYFTPQLRPAIAPRKSRLERKLQGARVAGTQDVITLINSHVVIRHSAIKCMSVSRGRKSTTAIRLERKVAPAIAPRNCTSQQLPRSVWNGFYIRTCTPQLHPAIATRKPRLDRVLDTIVWRASHPLASLRLTVLI